MLVGVSQGTRQVNNPFPRFKNHALECDLVEVQPLHP